MQAVAETFERTLERVGAALYESFTGTSTCPRWGVAGLREEALVFLLAESMRTLGWTCAYEQSCAGGGRYRGDILATRLGAQPVWIETKWWWRHFGLEEVLACDQWKLRAVRATHRPIAVVFTVDAESARDGWTHQGAKAWFREHVPKGWKLVGYACAPSPYHGTSSWDPPPRKPGDQPLGVFATAFFELVG